MKVFWIILLIINCGCSSIRSIEFPPSDRSIVAIIEPKFKINPYNKYALIIKGQSFEAPTGAFMLSTIEDLSQGPVIKDQFIDNDIDQISHLALSKNYDVYLAEMGQVTPAQIYAKLQQIAVVANSQTQIFIAYSGEGDKRGLITRRCVVSEGRSLTTETARIIPEELIAVLNKIPGSKAILLNACESGCVAEAARKVEDFQGVVIAACDIGYATTPSDSDNLTAIYATFLREYQDDPRAIKNLSTINWGTAGYWWTNFRHHISNIGANGLPISYHPVIFSCGNFLF